MASAIRITGRSRTRGWPILAMRSSQLAYLLAVDAGALTLAILALVHPRLSGQDLSLLAFLTVLALAFEEGVSRAARLQLRLSADLKRDMTSVWAIAGAVALPRASSVLLLAAVLAYVWLRQQRPAGEHFYRKAFNAAVVLLGSLTAGSAVEAANDAWGGSPWMVSGTVSVVIAMLVYAAANRLLVTVALLVLGVRGHALLGSREDNLIELATICLGGLVALAAQHEPILCVLVIAPMVSLQRGALVRELEAAAMIDAKTGLLNAVAWEQLAKRELAHARRDAKPLSILIIDIDRFKLVNDQFGHLVGDRVLHSVGKMLAEEVRAYDTVGRFGGEEFVAVLPEAGDAEALSVAERLRARINELRVSAVIDEVAADDSPLAVSIGVACSVSDGEELADLLVAADGALYRAKAEGRNRVRLAERGTGEFAPVVPV
jgi:diguanylate cyclase (GGDEF)-like protein